MDKIYIRDLAVNCIIGTNPEERKYKQEVIINLILELDLSLSGRSDNIDDTINYMSLKNDITSHIENSSYFLIERLADRIADISLKNELVKTVTVTIDKPSAVMHTRSVAVEIFRRKF